MEIKNDTFIMPTAKVVFFENEDIVTVSDPYVPGVDETPVVPIDG